MQSAVHDAVTGVQAPRFSWAPPAVNNSADEAIELCAAVGMPLDEWQQTALKLMLGERADGKWAAFEAALIVARQNGKGGVLEARELAGLFLFGEQLIIHSAHQFDTSIEAFIRMKNLIDGSDFLSKRVKKVSASHGDEGFLLTSGQRLRYKARTAGGGRGFSGDLVVLDEAQKLTARELAALMPTLSARPNPQLVYTGTVSPEATILRRLVERGRKGEDAHLAFAEWSAEDDADPTDPMVWAQANPALGGRISVDYIHAEQASLPAVEFAQERLSIWPEIMQVGTVIPVDAWAACEDSSAGYPGGAEAVKSIGVAVAADRSWASVAVAGMTDDELAYVEVVERGVGTDWLLPWLTSTDRKWRRPTLIIDQGGPAATMVPAFTAAGLKVRTTDTSNYKAACAGFVDAVQVKKIIHRGQPVLTEAAHNVKERKVGDQWVFARRDSGTMIDPLEAAALAVWHVMTVKKRRPKVFDWNEAGE